MTETSSEHRWREELNVAMSAFLKPYASGSCDGLYDPIHYLLGLGGKRIRPLLALATCEAEGESLAKAMPSALAVELFHNFTLMHDDIMDEAPLRRGRPTVHVKWDENAAILSGDVMYTLALTALAQTHASALPAVLDLFNTTAREVCEGQQSDMAFERMEGVGESAYLDMIQNKTSVLLAASAAMGALSAGADKARSQAWYDYGLNVGLAFQIQDDLLDAFGESGQTGKQVGGDILCDKKTLIWLHTASTNQGEVLRKWLGIQPAQGSDQAAEKIRCVREAMEAAGADVRAKELMQKHVGLAMDALGRLELAEDKQQWFAALAEHVATRNH